MLIEQTVLEYLQRELDMDEVYPEIPNPIPEKFVVLHVIDRNKSDQINEVTIEFMSYASSKYEAAVLDDQVRTAMEEIVQIDDISCHFGGGNDNPDTTLKKPRYRCYFNLFF